MMILGGAKRFHAWKRFNISKPWLLRPIVAPAEYIFYHPLFSPTMNWIILCFAPPPHELKPNSAHAHG